MTQSEEKECITVIGRGRAREDRGGRVMINVWGTGTIYRKAFTMNIKRAELREAMS